MPTIALEASENRPAAGEEHQSGRLENADYTTRVAELVKIPAAVRFLSVEPLLGPTPSGPRHRVIQPEWVRSIRDQCTAAGVAFFFKQWGGHTPKSGGDCLMGAPGTRCRWPACWSMNAGDGYLARSGGPWTRDYLKNYAEGFNLTALRSLRSPCGRRH